MAASSPLFFSFSSFLPGLPCRIYHPKAFGLCRGYGVAAQVVLVWNCHQDGASARLRFSAFAAELWRRGHLGNPAETAPRRRGALSARKSRKLRRPLLLSVTVNFQTSRGNAILGPHWKHLHGPDSMWQVTWGSLGPVAVLPADCYTLFEKWGVVHGRPRNHISAA